MIIELSKSKRKNKKWSVKVKNKTIHFGDSRYQDYTMHKNKERRKRYRLRHKKILTKDGRVAYLQKNKPAFWAYHVLW